MNNNYKIDALSIKKDIIDINNALIDNARNSFWWFCKVLEPEFYKDSRTYLRELCDTLQALYEGRIVKYINVDMKSTNSATPTNEWVIEKSNIITNDMVSCTSSTTICNKLMINLPPQHGKSRTLVNFCRWCFGKNNKERVITWSYNDDTASDFSRYTRDGIARVKETEFEIAYSDIFPDTKLKQGNAGHEKWALAGNYFSYLGAGLNGSITGKSGTIRIVDDPVKDSVEGLNEERLDMIWKKYTDTFLSRVSGHYIDIVNHTRWNSKDLCGRLLKIQPEKWYVFRREVYNKETDTMLCDELLNKESYLDIKQLSSPEIFSANYHQIPIDVMGRLYNNINFYELKYNEGTPYGVYTCGSLRTNINDQEVEVITFEDIIAYVDTADTGKDYLCCIIAGVSKGELYIIDVLYTLAAMEETEPATASLLYKNKVNKCLIESNSGGRGFARNVIRLLWDKHRTRNTNVRWFHQSKNKISRIIAASSFVVNHVYFPDSIYDTHEEFFESLIQYQKAGKNKHDDSVDTLTGLTEMTISNTSTKVIKIRK